MGSCRSLIVAKPSVKAYPSIGAQTDLKARRGGSEECEYLALFQSSFMHTHMNAKVSHFALEDSKSIEDPLMRLPVIHRRAPQNHSLAGVRTRAGRDGFGELKIINVARRAGK